jgi:hypothetical protein
MALKAKPNKGHYALAALARQNPDFLCLSQNVDRSSFPMSLPPLKHLTNPLPDLHVRANRMSKHSVIPLLPLACGLRSPQQVIHAPGRRTEG